MAIKAEINKKKQVEINNDKKPALYSFKKIIFFSAIVLLLAFTILALKPSLITKSYLFQLSNIHTSFKNNNQEDLLKNTQKTMATAIDSWKNAKSIYEFEAKDIEGNVIDLSKYK
jgi:hypothetical protein